MHCVHCEREIITDSDVCPICNTHFVPSKNVSQEQNIESNFNEPKSSYQKINQSQELVDAFEKKSRQEILEDYEKQYLKEKENILAEQNDKDEEKKNSRKKILDEYEKKYLEKLGYSSDSGKKKTRKAEFEHYEKEYLRRLGHEND